jgi:hypothetical protein
MKTIRISETSAGSHVINETVRLWDGDTLVVYHEDSEDNAGVKGLRGTTRRIRNEDYLPHRVMTLKRKYLHG